jgi:predicted AAA+ superfamily ATPase
MKNKENLHKYLKNNYTKLPNKIFKLGLPTQCIGFYAFLISLPEDFNPSIKFIENRLRLSKKTVIKYFEYLEALNIVKKLTQGNVKTRSTYELIPSSEWKTL